MHQINVALEHALQQRTPESWDEVDRLARQAIERKFSSPDDVKRLIALALRRSGFPLADEDLSQENWTEALLAKILKHLEDLDSIRDQFATIPHVVHSINRSGRLIAVTDSWLEFVGYTSRNDVLGKRSVDFLTPGSQEKAKSVVPQFWQDGYVIDCRYEMIRSNGNIIEVGFDAVGVRDENGEFANSLCAIRKI